MPLSDEFYMISVAASTAENDGFPDTAKKLWALAEKVNVHAPRNKMELRGRAQKSYPFAHECHRIAPEC